MSCSAPSPSTGIKQGGSILLPGQLFGRFSSTSALLTLIHVANHRAKRPPPQFHDTFLSSVSIFCITRGVAAVSPPKRRSYLTGAGPDEEVGIHLPTPSIFYNFIWVVLRTAFSPSRVTPTSKITRIRLSYATNLDSSSLG